VCDLTEAVTGHDLSYIIVARLALSRVHTSAKAADVQLLLLQMPDITDPPMWNILQGLSRSPPNHNPNPNPHVT